MYRFLFLYSKQTVHPRALNPPTARKPPLVKVCSFLLYHLDSLSKYSLVPTV